MGIQYAKIERRRAALREEFGRSLLIKKFGAAGAALVLEAFGTYRHGKHKGEPRGFIHWDKVVVGGWVRSGDGERGHVERPGSRNFAVSLNYERGHMRGVGEMSARDGVPNMDDAEWLLTLSRGLGVMTDRWNREKDEPVGDFPARWAEIRADAQATKAAQIAAMRAQYFAEASAEQSA